MTKDQLRDPARPAVPARRDPRRGPRADEPPYYRPGQGSTPVRVPAERRRGRSAGPLPSRVVRGRGRCRPARADGLRRVRAPGRGGQEVSTTMAFARLLRNLIARPGDRPVGRADRPRRGPDLRARRPVRRGEDLRARAASATPRSTPACRCTTPRAARRPDPPGGHHRGRRAWRSFTAAGHRRTPPGAQPMVPVYLFYSMFGFQRVGDLIWALGDSRGRGFLARLHRRPHHAERRGAPARGRPVPPARLDAPDRAPPTTRPSPTRWRRSCEDGIRGMCGPKPEDRFCYLTLYNENYPMPALPEGERGRPGRRGHRRGLYRFAEPAPVRALPAGRRRQPAPAGDDPVLRDRLAGRRSRPGASRRRTGTWPPRPGRSTSYKTLREDALEVERWNRLHPDETPRVPYVTRALADGVGTDRRRHRLHAAVPDQVARFVNVPVHVARHRRLRAVRHPGGPAPALRGRRRAHRRRRALVARLERRRQARRGRAGDLRLRHRPGSPRPPRRLSNGAAASPLDPGRVRGALSRPSN